jgi:peptidyl-prolyl cis-trans isomerase D
MFDFVRKHNRVMQFLLVLLIFPSFVLFGLEGYNRYREKGEDAARVDGHDISQQEWDQAYKMEVDRIRQQMPTLDAKVFDTPEAKYGALERLVRERVIAAAAQHSNLATSDQRLARELGRNEIIASLRGPDGKLDMAKYRQLVSSQGMTPEMFENQMRMDLSGRQVFAGIETTAVPVAAPADVALGAFYEKREVQVARFATSDFAPRVKVSDADVEAFYKANPQMFQAPEAASIEYVVLDLDAVKKGITLNDQDLKTYYDQNAARLAGQEERRASHILIAAGKTASAADKDKAKAKAQALFEQVKKNPASFAEVAKKNSQDPGSAVQGGDLDFFARSAMTKPFADAVFAAKKGDIVGPVETEFGYHVIQVTDIKASQQKSFEAMKPELEAEVMKQQAQKKFAEAAETFSNTVYEQSDSLKPVADKLKLEIRKADHVARTPQQGVTGALGNPKFLAALFAPDSAEKKRNTEAVEVGPQQIAAGRVVQYTPAHTRPLAEVKDQAREAVVAQRAAELARKEGLAKLAAWKAAPASAELPAAVVVSRQETQKLPNAVVDAAMRADPGALPRFEGVDLGMQGYAVVKVDKVIPRAAPAADALVKEREQVARAFAGAESAAYYELLKERFKVKMKAPKPGGATTPQQ